MVKAITTAFPEATHTLCMRHLWQNANQKLQDDAVDKKERNKLLDMIFGTDGIISADDTVCFKEKCTEFESVLQGVTEKFCSYFQKQLKEPLKTKVNEPVRKRWFHQTGQIITVNQLIMFLSRQLIGRPNH